MDHTTPTAQAPEATLTIGDLARRTGVSTAVLRMWETRHGFPVAVRLASGHRRYPDETVRLVERVVRRRDAGTRLETAISEVSSTEAPGSPSIYAELRRRHPTLLTHRLRKSTLIALSHAIEDECCAVADQPVLLGAFQRAEFYSASAARWKELARVARSTTVFADTWPDDVPTSADLRHVSLAADAPLRREWAVVCDAPDGGACLTAWELPGQDHVRDRDRLFEAAWTLEPTAVRDAARVAAGVAARAGAGPDLLDALDETPLPATPDPLRTAALFSRVVAYVDRARG